MEFFAANIRNRNTRLAYARAVNRFCQWCECHHFDLDLIEPVTVATYIEEMQRSHAAPSVKQSLAAVRMLFDWLVIGQIVPHNPAASVRGPRYVVKRGKTPVLSAEDARHLLDSIPTVRRARSGDAFAEVPDIGGLRDRALIAVMVFSFARVSAVVGMSAADYYQNGKRSWIRLHEKGGKFHEVPVHHKAEFYLDEYITATNLGCERDSPLFRTLDRRNHATSSRMTRSDALRMIKRRAMKAGLATTTCCHTFRATGITAYLQNGGTIEKAQAIAAHESPRTTKLYDRTQDELTLDEIERILI